MQLSTETPQFKCTSVSLELSLKISVQQLLTFNILYGLKLSMSISNCDSLGSKDQEGKRATYKGQSPFMGSMMQSNPEI